MIIAKQSIQSLEYLPASQHVVTIYWNCGILIVDTKRSEEL